MTATTIYPRFLGVDSNGDFVWELPTGRWTWGDDPHSAAFRQRTFTPDRYIEKYGRPIPFIRLDPETGKTVMADPVDRKAEADQDPAELAKLYVIETEPENFLEKYGYDPGPTVLNAAGWPVPVDSKEGKS
jgi:hypothetical protein